MNNLNLEMTKAPARPIRVVQYGGGNFLRAFVDYFFDLANEKGLFNGSIAVVESLENSNVDRFKGQDCQYTLQLRGNVNGEKYIADVRHEYYSKADPGFSVDIYESCDQRYHIGWLFSVKNLMK